MASWAGALGQEVGGMMQERSADMREERMKDEDYAREKQLAKQRQTAEDQRLNKRLAADDARQQRTIEANKAIEESRQTFETGYRDADREMEWNLNVMREQSDMWQAAMRAYMTKSKTKSMSGGGWSSKIDREQVIENGQMVTREYADISGPNNRPYVMRDGRVLEVDQSEPPHTFESVDLQKKAEGDLMSGEITAEQFQRHFKYLPADYVYGKMSANDTGFHKFLETENIRLPAFNNYMNATGDRRGSDRRDSGEPYGEGGPGSSGPESRRLMEIDKAKGDVTAEESDQAVRDRRSRAGLPEYPANKGKFNDPYVSGKSGETSEHGEKVNAARSTEIDGLISHEEAGLLTQGQMAEGELETGGQMGPPTPETQAAATAPGGELDEAGAAEISQMIQQANIARAEAAGRADQLPDPLGAFKEVGGILAKPFGKRETPRHTPLTPEEQQALTGTP